MELQRPSIVSDGLSRKSEFGFGNRNTPSTLGICLLQISILNENAFKLKVDRVGTVPSSIGNPFKILAYHRAGSDRSSDGILI